MNVMLIAVTMLVKLGARMQLTLVRMHNFMFVLKRKVQ